MPLHAPMVSYNHNREPESKRAEVKAVCLHGTVTKLYANGKVVVFRCCLCQEFLESLR